MKLKKQLFSIITTSLVFFSNAWYDTNKINVETSIENLNHYSDLIMVKEGVFSDALLTVVPRLSGWSHYSSSSVYSDYADSSLKSYKFQWSYNPNSYFYITERINTDNGNIVEASCTTSAPLVATCSVLITGTRDVVFFVTAR